MTTASEQGRIQAGLLLFVLLAGVGAGLGIRLLLAPAPPAPPPPASSDRLADELAALRRELAESSQQRSADFESALRSQKEEMERRFAALGGNEREKFSALLSRYKRSLLLVYAETRILLPGVAEPIRMGGYGSAWVADTSGLAITNKHVVQSWKFEPRVDPILAAHPGWRVETSLHAWPAGERFLDDGGRMRMEVGYHSPDTLRLALTAPDIWRYVEIAGDGGPVKARMHDNTDEDLAVLQVTGGPCEPLPVKADPAALKELDPVMLLGFPLGARVLEAGHVDVSASLGTVRFVRETVSHTASAFPGNSGGPLVALDGEVVGVLTRSPIVTESSAAETMSMAIRSDRVRSLLDIARCSRGDPPDCWQLMHVPAECLLEVRTETSGRVVSLPKEPGDTIDPGDVLLRFDGWDEKLSVAECEASLAEGEVRLEAAEKQLGRLRQLAEMGATSAASVKDAEAARADALAAREEQKARLERARTAATAIVRTSEPGILVDYLVETGQTLAQGAPFARVIRREDNKDWKTPGLFAAGKAIVVIVEARDDWRFLEWSDGSRARARILTSGEGVPLVARFAR